jgi:ketosteroid isomerase-like protein
MRRFIMLKKLAIMAATVAPLVAGGCAKKVDLEGARAELRATDTEWSNAAGNVDAWLGYFAAEGAIYPPNEAAVVGAENIRAWGSTMMSMPGFAVSWEPQTVEVAASGDVGYTAGTYTFSAQDPSGQPMNDHGKYLCTWKRDASGAWKAVIDTWNSDVPMASAAPVDTTAMPK